MPLDSVNSPFATRPASGRPVLPADPPRTSAAMARDPLRKACQEFESIFISIVFRQMLDSACAGSGGTVAGAGVLEMLGDQAFAGQIARNGGFGLSDYLYRLLAKSPAGSTLDLYQGAR